MITIEQVRSFQRALSTAQWKLDLYKFATAIDEDPRHQHAQSMFRVFTDANKAINRFDAETLTKILNATEHSTTSTDGESER